jgi:hypothetical protein
MQGDKPFSCALEYVSMLETFEHWTGSDLVVSLLLLSPRLISAL